MRQHKIYIFTVGVVEVHGRGRVSDGVGVEVHVTVKSEKLGSSFCTCSRFMALVGHFANFALGQGDGFILFRRRNLGVPFMAL